MACCHLIARIRSHTARVPVNRIPAAAVTPANIASAAVTASTAARVVGVWFVGQRAVVVDPDRDVVAGLGRRLRRDRAGVFGSGSRPPGRHGGGVGSWDVLGGSVVGDRRGDEVTSVVLLGVDVAA